MWAAWYDIFVRQAFGNYRQLLREVVYSPVMSFYLTYHNNKAYASAGTIPDENFAREIMQVGAPQMKVGSGTGMQSRSHTSLKLST